MLIWVYLTSEFWHYLLQKGGLIREAGQERTATVWGLVFNHLEVRMALKPEIADVMSWLTWLLASCAAAPGSFDIRGAVILASLIHLQAGRPSSPQDWSPRILACRSLEDQFESKVFQRASSHATYRKNLVHGCPTFWLAWATICEESLCWAAYT